jgi:hypothetical protein
MTKRYPLDIPRRVLDLLAEGRAVESTAPVFRDLGHGSSPHRSTPKECAEFLGNEDPSKPQSFSSSSSKARLVGYTSRTIQILLVGRLSLDTSARGVFLERPGTSLSVHMCWLEEVECPPTSFEVLSRLNSWLDN